MLKITVVSAFFNLIYILTKYEKHEETLELIRFFLILFLKVHFVECIKRSCVFRRWSISERNGLPLGKAESRGMGTHISRRYRQQRTLIFVTSTFVCGTS